MSKSGDASDPAHRGTWRRLRQAFWALDALLFVLGYTALLLLIPTRTFPNPPARNRTRPS